MKGSITGQYSALEVRSEVIQALPKPAAAAWTKVLTAQQEWRKAKVALAEAQQVKEAAGSEDVTLERSLRDKVEDALRVVVKAADEADTAELVFLARLHEHRAETVEGYKLQAMQELEEANAALRTLQDCMDRFGVSLSLWNWSRRDEDQIPPSQGMEVYLRRYGVAVPQLLQEISSQIDKEHPDSILAVEEEYLRQWLISTGKATPDGLVVDAAARRAYAS